MPCSRASSSLSPTVAISGSEKITMGTAAGSSTVGRPHSASAATIAWALALWASGGPATTSPIAATRVVDKHVGADLDQAVGPDRYARGGQPEVVRVGYSAVRHDHALHGDPILTVGGADDQHVAVEALSGGADAHVNAQPAEPTQHRRSQGGVERGQDWLRASTRVTFAPSLANAVASPSPM